MQEYRFGFSYAAPPKGSGDPKYRHHLRRSVRNSIYLNLKTTQDVNIARHYCFATRRGESDIGREEYDALVTAMHVARIAFLDGCRLLSEADHDMRAALGRSSNYRHGMHQMHTQEVAKALYEEVKDGRIAFVPDRDELHACVHEILADRNKKRSSRGAASRARLRSPTEVLYGKTPGIAPAPVSQFMEEEAGPDVNALVSRSPSLQDELKKLGDDGWEIRYGKLGGGSYAIRDIKNVIVLDENLKNNSAAYAQVLSHEVGHATYLYQQDLSSRAAYVQSTLRDEAAATMNNIRVQREILSNSGIDMGVAGGNYSAYNRAYDVYLKDGDAAACREAISRVFGNEITSTTGQTYSDYYGAAYDLANPPGR